MPVAATQRMLPAASRAGIRSVKIDMVVVLLAGCGTRAETGPARVFGNLPVRRRCLAPGSTKESRMPQIQASGAHASAIMLKPRAIFFVSCVSQTTSCSGNLGLAVEIADDRSQACTGAARGHDRAAGPRRH